MNLDRLKTRALLIDAFLVPAYENVLDISYSVTNIRTIKCQVILKEESLLSPNIIEKLNNNFPNHNLEYIIKDISKEEFNSIEDDWLPVRYEWLDTLLFSKNKYE